MNVAIWFLVLLYQESQDTQGFVWLLLKLIRLSVYYSSCSSSQAVLDFWGSIHFFFPRQEFNQDDIVLNYRDPEGDLIRLLSDQDVELMVSLSRKSPSVKHFFPWKLHITHKDDLGVYNTSPGTGATQTVGAM